jgi:hypothetical protein
MAMKGVSEQVTARIGFAERWLLRARQQCAEGDLAHGVLTLALAGAEMRRALEVAGAPMRRAGRHATIGRGLVAAAVLVAAGAVLALHRYAPLSPVASTPAPVVVQLAPTTGDVLPSVAAGRTPAVRTDQVTDPGASARRAVATSTGIGVQFGQSSKERATAALVVRPQEAAQSRRGRPAAVEAQPGASTALTTPLLSLGDFVDLVLAAERALRSEPTGLYSP